MRQRNITLIRALRGAAIVMASLLVLPSGVLAHHCKGSHANDPGCAGSGGGDELALSVTFQCPVTGTDRNCVSVPNDRIQGDGQGPFVDGVEKVSAVLTQFGRFRLNTGGNKKTGSDRNVYWDFTEGGGSSVPMTAVPGGVTTTDTIGYPYRTVIHLNRRNDLADLRDMTIGDEVFLDMWGDILLSDGGSTSSIFIRFDSQDANNECPSSPGSQDVPVVRVSETRWVVEVPADTVACVAIADSENPAMTGMNADYVMGPFSFEFEALP